ncbi:MAG: helix-turn-helix transcriptional regulator [Clostridia bacterium]|nr:helix-turn-helix transcriptional regulator [Clostridia bacterium]
MELVVGEKLKKLRRNRDLTQEEVATHICISYQAISKKAHCKGRYTTILSEVD